MAVPAIVWSAFNLMAAKDSSCANKAPATPDTNKAIKNCSDPQKLDQL